MGDKLKWFIRWNGDYQMWEVMKGGFRHCMDRNKYVAMTERDRLNRMEGN